MASSVAPPSVMLPVEADTTSWPYPVVPLPGLVPSSSVTNVEPLSSVTLPLAVRTLGLEWPGLIVPPTLVMAPTLPLPPRMPALSCTSEVVPSTSSVVPDATVVGPVYVFTSKRSAVPPPDTFTATGPDSTPLKLSTAPRPP